MSRPNTQISHTAHTEQRILNDSFDPDFNVLVTEGLEYDPAGNLKRVVTGDLTSRIVVSGSVTYIGEASVGSATSSAVWQVTKVDTSSSPQTIKLAGTGAFDQVFDNYASLTYN